MNTSSKERAKLAEGGVAEEIEGEPWEYIDADTQALTHNLHRYSGKFIPQIAARAITTLTQPGESVLDPYCGSGTTLVEAALLGRKAIGLDLNPLALLIASTKITPVPANKLHWLQTLLSDALDEFAAPESLPLFKTKSSLGTSIASDPRLSEPWFAKWFQPAVLKELLAINRVVDEIKDVALRNIGKVAFSDILRKSSNAHSGYPNIMFDKKAPERVRPIRPFLKTLAKVCEMVGSLEQTAARWGEVRVQRGDATRIPLNDASIDAVVSHPPYIGSVPYAEYGLLSLKWLGADPRELDRQLTGGRRQSPDVVSRFRNGYGAMLNETARVLRPSRYVFLMVGNPVVKGKTIDLAVMTLELAKEAGLRLISRATRSGGNRRANKMGQEHLLVFRNSRGISRPRS